MKVHDAYPPQSPGKRPICEGQLSAGTTEFNEARERNGSNLISKRRKLLKIPADQCDANARYYVRGKWLCRKHAAYFVLDAIAEEPSEEIEAMMDHIQKRAAK